MTELSAPIATQLATSAFEQQLVRPAEKLVIDESPGVDVAKVLSLFPRDIGVDRAAHQIVFAEQQRVYRR